jgi:periplasmic divalent cation tolerance protein
VLLLSSGYVVVFCTAPPNHSGRLARLVIEERLAACVSISQVRSTFLWKGRVEEEAEDLLIIKTEDLLVEELTSRIREVHPYELPEIVVLPIIGGEQGYLDWISESVRKRPGSSSEEPKPEDV